MQATGQGTSTLVRALATPKFTTTKPGGGKGRGRASRDSSSIPPAPHVPIIFPKLAYLSLKGLDFAESEHQSGILLDVVEKGLRRRRLAYKAPLKMLRIDNCAISTKRAKALEKLVQRFCWDREGNEFEDLALWAFHNIIYFSSEF
jgi:hypothetical protein